MPAAGAAPVARPSAWTRPTASMLLRSDTGEAEGATGAEVLRAAAGTVTAAPLPGPARVRGAGER